MQDPASFVPIPIPGFSEPLSSWTHLCAAFIAFLGWIILLRKGRGNKLRIFTLSVFSFSMVFLFSMSGVYHLLEPGGLAREVFRRLDHAGIWVLIVGSFTPIHTLLFRGIWRWGFLFFIWTIAITGMVLEVIFFDNFPEWLSLTCYLSLGWMGVLTGIKYSKQYGHHGAKLLVLGGITYSIGGLLEYLRWPVLVPGVIGPHELFHFFVMGGCFCHYLFIYDRAGYPVINQIIVDVIERPGPQFWAKMRGENLFFRASSLHEIKNKIHVKVVQLFPSTVRPNEIILKLKKEDLISL